MTKVGLGKLAHQQKPLVGCGVAKLAGAFQQNWKLKNEKYEFCFVKTETHLQTDLYLFTLREKCPY